MESFISGLYAAYTDKILSGKDYYRKYLNFETDSDAFHSAMKSDKDLDGVPGFGAWNRQRISTTPPDDRMPTERLIGYLNQKGVVNTDIAMLYEGFDEYRSFIRENYDFAEYITYVYPEDERLMYATAKLANTESVFFAGSYFGYLAIWAMPAIKNNNGKITLSDINPNVCNLARKNIDNLGFGNCAEVINESADTILQRRSEPIDMLVLDATGLGDDPRPEYRGKRIYGTLLGEAKHLLHKGSCIFIHNMEPEIADMKPLVDGLASIGAVGTNYDTFNGLGVYIVS